MIAAAMQSHLKTRIRISFKLEHGQISSSCFFVMNTDYRWVQINGPDIIFRTGELWAKHFSFCREELFYCLHCICERNTWNSKVSCVRSLATRFSFYTFDIFYCSFTLRSRIFIILLLVTSQIGDWLSSGQSSLYGM